MSPILRIIGIIFAFCITSIGWMILGGVTSHRAGAQSSELRGEVADLWGSPQTQAAPTLSFAWVTEREVVRTERSGGEETLVRERVAETQRKDVSASSTRITADLRLDRRLRGLVWYALYDVSFDGAWTYDHKEAAPGRLTLSFRFPNGEAIYDQFRFAVDGEDHAKALRPTNGAVSMDIEVKTGQRVTLAVAYKSRGMSEWRYAAGSGVANLEDFNLTMTTDFALIDFPGATMSPSAKERQGAGWKLDWTFRQALTGRGIGMIMPNHIQPGELSSSLTFSAPISLFFFFLVIFVLATIRRIDIHPINYLFLGAAFLCFHLLFAYSVDHIPVVHAFVLASVVSLILVVSYLRLVVSARFAFIEAGLAQLVYLIGFSLAHFWHGYTGLTVTILSVVTVFLLMQLTGRIRWSEALAKRPAPT
jgi:hypothetical protein